MHYQRQRRTGDPTEVRPAGRPVDVRRRLLRAQMGEDFASERTFARYWRAWQLLDAFGDKRAALSEAVRPNGSINVAELTGQAERAVMAYVAEQERVEQRERLAHESRLFDLTRLGLTVAEAEEILALPDNPLDHYCPECHAPEGEPCEGDGYCEARLSP